MQEKETRGPHSCSAENDQEKVRHHSYSHTEGGGAGGGKVTRGPHSCSAENDQEKVRNHIYSH